MIDNDEAELERRRHLYEMDHPSDEDERWLKFCRDAELLIGQGLDGDEATDGFSLDSAHDAFKAGKKPVEYANAVARKQQDLDI